MIVEVIVKSSKIRGLIRKFEFPIRSEQDLDPMFMIELLDEISKLENSEIELSQWMSNTGKKVRF